MSVKMTTFLAAALLALLAPTAAWAMCGCMMPVDDTGIPEQTRLTSDATQVVLMRHGTTTIQTIQNRYEGPVADFAIVIPTPEVLTEEQVKTLHPAVFEDIDALSAPKLTEYWQHDPCEQVDGFESVGAGADDRASNNGVAEPPAEPGNGGVVVEAEFAVGEYEIQILSAEQGTSLEEWLTDNGYRIPAGASEYLQPYIDMGMYFFVAKVDVEKVRMEDGEAVLSPLRFHYDAADLALPTRLGMVNSAGRQDLIVYALGESRFEAANHPNATIPTNVPVSQRVKNDFGTFYDQLFEKTLEAHGSALVTEFAGPVWGIDPKHIAALGGDVVGELYAEAFPHSFVLSRLHFRYSKDDFGEDLVFRAADPIIGGAEAWNERTVDPTLMEQGAMDSHANNFRAHYFIMHEWTGPVTCENPASRWGGNPNAEPGAGHQPEVFVALSPNTTKDDVFRDDGKRDLVVAEVIEEDIPEIGLERQVRPKRSPSACSSAQTFGDAIPFGLLAMMLGFAGMIRRRSRRTN